jgi:Glycine zipper
VARKLISVAVSAAFMASLVSCATIPEEHKGAATGAGVGAAAGTVAGAVFGGSTKAAVLGGLFGALVGGVIGHYGYDQKKTRDETAKDYKYSESQGTVLSIEEASVDPETISPGGAMQLKTTYAVMNPNPNTETAITEIREITHNGELVGRPEVKVSRSDGTYVSAVPIHLPSNAKKGEYRVRMTIESENAKDTREATFTVQ